MRIRQIVFKTYCSPVARLCRGRIMAPTSWAKTLGILSRPHLLKDNVHELLASMLRVVHTSGSVYSHRCDVPRGPSMLIHKCDPT